MISTVMRSGKIIVILLTVLALAMYMTSWFTHEKKNYSPKILVLGDSQISFGAGKVYLEFFNRLVLDLPNLTNNERILEIFGKAEAAAIGVRSTSLDNWTERNDGNTKDVICEIDKRWGVNAGVYGIEGNQKRVYVNIGQGEAYQFCDKNLSAFETMFADGYYAPELLVLAFLGNSAERWAYSPEKALADVDKTMEQIPSHIPCIFLTTSPSYDKATNDLRVLAQANIEKAFKPYRDRCSFVSGLTKETIMAAQGNKSFFKTNDEGEVIDIHHPNLDAARKFFEIRKDALRQAILDQLEMKFEAAPIL